jgi:release factor glutamine methyltransferase
MEKINEILTIKDALIAASLKLAKKDNINSRLEARILLQYVTNLTPEQLIRDYNRELTILERKKLDELIEKRLSHIPISHLIGKREFWGLEFKVTKDTLDPRPDSETLIEAAISLFPDKQAPLNIIDLGTGTGCLLLTLLSEYKNANGDGVDVSSEAIKVAEENARFLNLNNRANFINSSWSDLNIITKFDLVISNPPYIKESDKNTLQPEVILHEPHTALFGGSDGLDCYRQIAEILPKFLKQDGIAIFEFGQNQEQAITNIFEQKNFKVIDYYNDLQGIVRSLSLTYIK